MVTIWRMSEDKLVSGNLRCSAMRMLAAVNGFVNRASFAAHLQTQSSRHAAAAGPTMREGMAPKSTVPKPLYSPEMPSVFSITLAVSLAPYTP